MGRAGVVAALLLAGLGAAGCGGGSTPDAGDSPSGSASAGASASASVSPPITTPTSATSATSPAPSSGGGLVLPMRSVTVTFPTGWKKEDGNAFTASIADPATGGQVIVTVDAAITGDTNDTQARFALRYAKGVVPNAHRVEDREVAGVLGYVIVGDSHLVPTFYDYGAVHGDWIVDISLEFDQANPDVDQVIESVLAGVEWK